MSRPCSVSSSSPCSPSMTTNAQLRKIKKPIIERRRRERINVCLNQLKSLVLEALNKNESCYSKMEKADILEMTVAHLQSIQHYRYKAGSPGDTDDEAAPVTYASGYQECARQVQNYLQTIDPRRTVPDDDGVRSCLFRFLTTRLEAVHRTMTQTDDFHPISSADDFSLVHLISPASQTDVEVKSIQFQNHTRLSRAEIVRNGCTENDSASTCPSTRVIESSAGSHLETLSCTSSRTQSHSELVSTCDTMSGANIVVATAVSTLAPLVTSVPLMMCTPIITLKGRLQTSRPRGDAYTQQMPATVPSSMELGHRALSPVANEPKTEHVTLNNLWRPW